MYKIKVFNERSVVVVAHATGSNWTFPTVVQRGPRSSCCCCCDEWGRPFAWMVRDIGRRDDGGDNVELENNKTNFSHC